MLLSTHILPKIHPCSYERVSGMSAIFKIVAVMAACCLFTGCASKKPGAEQFYQDGVRSKEQGDFAQAIEHFRTALTYDPYYAEAYVELGVLTCRSRNYAYAVKQLLRGIEYGASSYRPYAYLGFAYEQLGTLPLAEANYRKALELAPNVTDVRLRLVDLLDVQGKKSEAAQMLQTLLTLYPQIEGADVLKARLALLQQPNNLEAHLAMADIYIRKGEIEHGLAQFNQYAPLDPKRPETIAAFGQFCAEREQQECAITYLKQAVTLGLAHQPDIRAALAENYEKAGNFQEALSEYQDLLRLQPQSTPVRLKIVELLERLDQRADAAELLETSFYRGLLSEDASELWRKIFALRGETGNKTVIQLKSWGQYNLINVMIGATVPATLLFDPTAEYAIISEDLAQKLNILLSTQTSEVHFFFNGQRLKAPLVNVSSIKVGTLEVRNVPALIWDFSDSPQIDGVLGKSFLKHFQIDLQPQHQLVVLTRSFS